MPYEATQLPFDTRGLLPKPRADVVIVALESLPSPTTKHRLERSAVSPFFSASHATPKRIIVASHDERPEAASCVLTRTRLEGNLASPTIHPSLWFILGSLLGTLPGPLPQVAQIWIFFKTYSIRTISIRILIGLLEGLLGTCVRHYRFNVFPNTNRQRIRKTLGNSVLLDCYGRSRRRWVLRKDYGMRCFVLKKCKAHGFYDVEASSLKQRRTDSLWCWQ